MLELELWREGEISKVHHIESALATDQALGHILVYRFLDKSSADRALKQVPTWTRWMRSRLGPSITSRKIFIFTQVGTDEEAEQLNQATALQD